MSTGVTPERSEALKRPRVAREVTTGGTGAQIFDFLLVQGFRLSISGLFDRTNSILLRSRFLQINQPFITYEGKFKTMWTISFAKNDLVNFKPL